MKSKIRTISIMLCLALCLSVVAFGMTACNDGTKKQGGSVNLIVWLAKEDQAFGNEVAEAFQEAYPDKEYNIMFGIQAESDAGTRVLQDTTNAPDVFAFASDHLMKLVNGGALNSVLGDRLETLKSEQTEAAVDSATIKVEGEDKTFAYPFTDNTIFLYYNKSKFSESDLTSVESILAKCTSSQRFAYPLADGFYSSAFFFGAGLGYTVERDDAFAETSVTTDFGNDTGKAVATYMYNLAKNSKVKGDSNDSKIVAGFQDGSVIAGVSGIWNKNAIEEALGENFGVAALPTFKLNGEDKYLTPFAGYKLLGVSQYSENKADAHLFAQFFTSYAMQVKHFEARGYNPTNKQAMALDNIKSDACVAAIQKVLEHSKSTKDVPSSLWSPLESFGNAMVGSSAAFDLDEQLKALVDAIEVKK